jgi:L-malate glycosyltransferase
VKIAYLLGKLDTGGTERLLLDVFQYPKEQNFEIIGVYRKKGQLEQDFLNSGGNIYKLEPKHRIDLLYLLKLRKLLKQHNIQIAHAQQPLDAILAYLSTVGTKIKVVLTLHGFGYGYSKLFLFLRKIAMKLVNLRIFVSYYQLKDFSLKFPFLKTKLNNVVYNGLLLKKYERTPESAIRQEFNIKGDMALMGCVGNFNAGRNQLYLCEFLYELNKIRPEFNFFFIGEKNEKEPWRYDRCVEYCKSNNLSNVIFTGLRNDITLILKQLNAFIYHSDHDTFGIAVIEAIAAGIPVFVNDWDVMLEITDNGKLANIYHSKEELMSILIDFMNHSDKYKNNALLASRIVREKFSIEQHINSLINAYSNLL